MPRNVRVIAPAKVNLFLGVGELLPDGYHRLDAVFHALSLHDDVVLTESDTLSVSCTPELDVPAEQNLAYRAATALGVAEGRDPNVHVELTKRIPHGAGLGGGSSDAAAVLAGLAGMWGLDPSQPRYLRVAAALGADVPFFLHGGAMLMSGRGDVPVRPLPPLDASIVLIRPRHPVSTAAAYQAFDRAPVPARDGSAVVAALEGADTAALGAALHNNFEDISIALVPEIGSVLEWMREQPGVLGATVAGSGSAVFGVVENEDMAQDISEAARPRGWWSTATRLSAEGVRVTDEEGSE